MSDLYVKKSYTGGNFRNGELEFVFGMKRPVARHLTGMDVVNTEFFAGVAQRPGRVRLYGLEEKSFDTLKVLTAGTAFTACSVHCVQAWTYRSSTVSGENIGKRAAVGGFATRSSNLRWWDDTLNKDRFDVEEIFYGPGFVEFSIPEWDAPDHGGRQVSFDPYEEIRDQLKELGVDFSENATSIVINKRKAKND
jgi:hypothetical protein